MNYGAKPLEADPKTIAAKVEALGPWFHNIDLGGVETAPDHFLGDYPAVKFNRFAHRIPRDLRGKTVLDIGCNAGFHAIEMKRRGADYVVGIDTDDRYLGQASFAAEALGYRGIDFRNLSVYDVAALGRRFDLVLFMGVLYHLRHPLLALDIVRDQVVEDQLVFQSMQRGSDQVTPLEEDYPFAERETFYETGYPKLHFVERMYAGDWSNWWIPNRACVEAMLRGSGFRIDARVEEEVYICSLADRPFADWGGDPVPALSTGRAGS